jgi:Putative transmembrane protein (PGPGW)
MKDDTKEVLRVRVARVQDSYGTHGPIFRVLWVVAGITVVLAGLAMTVIPGPAVVVLPVGLAMLAAEFTWARRLLDVGIDRGVDAKRRVQRAAPAAKLLTVLAVLSLAAAVVAFLLLR